MAAAAALFGTAVGLALALTGLLSGVEEQALAARFAIRGASVPSDVLVVGVDDKSLGQLRHTWPFPRSWHGKVLEQLHRAGARAVLVDIEFSVPTQQAQDLALYDALARTGGAVLSTTTRLLRNGHSTVLGGDANLARVHSRAGAALLPVDDGGVVEKIEFHQGGISTAAIDVAERVLGTRFHLPGGSDAFIDYRGGLGTVPMLSYADVLSGHFDPRLVRGKVVVLGATSPLLQDTHATPVSSGELMSGPEIQANAVWTALHGFPLKDTPFAATLLLILICALFPPLLRVRRSVATLAIAVPATAALYLVIAQLAFDQGTVLRVVAPLGALLTAAVATVVGSHLLESRELRVTQREVVLRLGRAAESRDGGTARHLERIGFLCERLAREVGFSREDAKLIHQASALHDVGKIAIPDAVLLKAGKFTDADRLVMNEHAAFGARMLSGSPTTLVKLAEEIAHGHHERWDGSGYPHHLEGEEIPLSARICAICDVFDALIAARHYKAGWTLAQTLDELRAGAGAQFDPVLVERFLKIAPALHRELVATGDPDLIAEASPPAPGAPPQDACNAPAAPRATVSA